MSTETILHSYQIILLPRQTGAHEVVITTPDGVTRRYTKKDANRRIRQIDDERRVMLTALDMLVSTSAASGQPHQQVAGGAG
jgi:hypothetical protein